MEIKSENVEGVHCIFLKGRLDIAGTQSVDLKFTSLTSAQRVPVIVDLEEVDFISSIGIRLFATNAKALHSFGAQMVLVNPQPVVTEILHSTGIDQLIPIAEDFSDALSILKVRVS